ncbi:MAG: hypothetical protein HYR49_02670 [Gammaproteobacteria bacterium]|nr:hypothetical protein [Gammaproteobacteria bacterium]
MKHLLSSMILASALLTGFMPAWSQEATETAPTATEPDAAPPDAGADKGMSVNIGVDLDKDGENDKSARISIETEGIGDEDDGPVARVVRNGVARILEKHVLTDEDLTEEERREVREAIAELRGDLQRETHDAAKEIDAATKEIDEAVKEKKHAIVLHDRKSRAKNDDDDSSMHNVPSWVGFVAVIAVILTLGLPIIVVALILYFSYRKRRLAHDTINGYLASGKEIPPEIMHNLFQEAGTSVQAPRTNFHKGTINTGIGLGMIVGFSVIDVEFLAAIGFIFLLIGLAQLLIWKLEQGKKGDQAQG